MKRRMMLTIAGLIVAFSPLQPSYDSSAQGGAKPAASGWTMLLDGTTLKGWNMVGEADWQVVDGAVQATKGAGGYLVTPNSYGDFQLTAEFWVSDDANSGIFIRCQDPKTITADNSYEVNIYDKRPDQSYRTGGIVNVAKPMVMINTGGKWNTFDITAQGTKLIVVLNGMKTVDMDHKGHVRGPIALQYGANSSMVKFRNVRIRQL